MLQVNNLCGGYDKQDILHDISCDIAKGEFVGILGPNGSGKSTLLRLLSRALTPSSGKVYFEQQELQTIRLKELYKKIAFVPQETLVNFAYTVEEIVLMGRLPHLGRLQIETVSDYKIVEESLLLTDSLHLKDKRIDQISAGERQRVIISRALAQKPSLIFLDEPTSHLDIGHQKQTLDLLLKLNKENNLTIIMVMHDLNMSAEYCHKTILLNEGKIVVQGLSTEVIKKEYIETVYKTEVAIDSNPISGKPCVFIKAGSIY